MHAEVTPISLNFWRWTVAVGIMLPFTGARLWSSRKIILKDWKKLLLLGFLGVALYQTLVYLALDSTTAVNAALIQSTIPVVIVAISWMVFREKVSRRQALGIATSLAGVLAIISQADISILLEFRFNMGDLWSLIAVPVWSLYTVLIRRDPPKIEPMVLLAAISIIGVVLLAPFYLWELRTGAVMKPDLPTVATVLYIALFASVIAFALWNHGVLAIGPNKAGLFLHLLPAYTTILAIFVLGESIHLYHGLGIGLIVFGIYLTTARGASPSGSKLSP